MDQKKSEIVNRLFEEAKGAFHKAQGERQLYDLKVQYIGKKGSLSLAMREIKDCPPEDKPSWGRLFNQIRSDLESLYFEKKTELSQRALEKSIKEEAMDLSLPGPALPAGAIHPITKVIERIWGIFKPLGYSIRTGPCVETDWHNFSALNFPPFHPSRDLQDTFYIGEDHVLRTHTSPVQIRVLESEAPPLAILAPGAVFRCDSDVSHAPMFHQVEGLYVNKKASMADLKGVLSYFLKELFQSSKTQVRFRPSFFPFTEPSAEYDVSCPFCSMKGCSVCKKSGWIEIGGCGLVHPKVFRSVKRNKKPGRVIDRRSKAHPEVFHSVKKRNSSQWQGFAFGLGVERLAVILYSIPDIRLFFENDIRFLKQFSAL